MSQVLWRERPRFVTLPSLSSLGLSFNSLIGRTIITEQALAISPRDAVGLPRANAIVLRKIFIE